ncbi:MAG: HD domain-containing phosphohydrolase [Candidatus Omnitrophota bacterium]|nr:HD domain-containing protein [Candidatus Omnitrophota bacterium]
MYLYLQKMKELDILLLMTRFIDKSGSVFAHGRRVAGIACAMAKKMGYCDEGIKHIHCAAVVHDIGKIDVPQEIVTKPGGLSGHEIAIIRKHPELGCFLLKDTKPESIVAEVALQHHERMDGSGYPFGLCARDIHPVARIVAVADVIDAMTSLQVYRPALSMHDALRELMRNRGSLYDAGVVDVSVSLFERGEYHV